MIQWSNQFIGAVVIFFGKGKLGILLIKIIQDTAKSNAVQKIKLPIIVFLTIYSVLFILLCYYIRYGPPTRTEYRLIVENLSSRVSWQVKNQDDGILFSFVYIYLY